MIDYKAVQCAVVPLNQPDS